MLILMMQFNRRKCISKGIYEEKKCVDLPTSFVVMFGLIGRVLEIILPVSSSGIMIFKKPCRSAIHASLGSGDG